MHELDVTKELVKQIKQLMNENSINKGKVFLEMGNLTTYSAEPIKFYYSQLTHADKSFVNKKIKLEIHEKKGELYCKECKTTSKINEIFERICPACGSINTQISGGDELKIKKVEKYE
ncbi:MAG: hydrogenase maturation nickel metallochaperone HypA [Nanobdellota archaeon]